MVDTYPQPLTLTVLTGTFAVTRLGPDQALPAWAWSGALASATCTEAELSIVSADAAVPDTVQTVERGWRALRVEGPLDFNLVGILARLSASLADAGISLFALSTFDTDYLLVRAADLENAVAALRRAVNVRHEHAGQIFVRPGDQRRPVLSPLVWPIA